MTSPKHEFETVLQEAKNAYTGGDPLEAITDYIERAYRLGIHHAQAAIAAGKASGVARGGHAVRQSMSGLLREWRDGLVCYALTCRRPAIGYLHLSDEHGQSFAPLCPTHVQQFLTETYIEVATKSGPLTIETYDLHPDYPDFQQKLPTYNPQPPSTDP